MRIRCKIAPYTWAWTAPKKRFVFKTDDWQEIDEYGLSVLKKKLIDKFNTCFEVKTESIPVEVETHTGVVTDMFKKNRRDK